MFEVTVNYCKLTTLTIPTYSDIYYDIGASSTIVTYTAWTSSYSAECGSLTPVGTYQSDSSTIATSGSHIIYSTSTRRLTIRTTNFNLAGSYPITFTATATGITVTRDMTIYI